jgi:carnitine 3-dehydrogenase
VANRLQAALWREAFYLVSQGIATVSEVDIAISHGPGLRWALLGPFLNLHISGGPGGIAHVLEHLGPSLESWWHDMGAVALSTELNKRLAAGVDEELAGTDLAVLTSQRDALLLGLLEQKAAMDARKPSLL